MKEKPILFSTPMVKAILEGRKTQTRRVINPQPDDDGVNGVTVEGFQTALYNAEEYWINTEEGESKQVKPKYEKGDILWVRETFQMYPASVILNGKAGNSPYKKIPKEKPVGYYIEYRATSDKVFCGKWRSSLFMPKYAARLFLKVTSVRLERLQDISEKDAKAEGVYPCFWFQPFGKPEGESITFDHNQPTHKAAFFNLWDILNAKCGYSWESNPWVWVYEFMRIEK
jgi:hypothetical protein